MRPASDLVDYARRLIGAKYVLGSSAPLMDPSYRGPFDCAEFVSYCVAQVTGRIWGAGPKNDNPYTGYWNAAIPDTKALLGDRVSNASGSLLRMSVDDAIRTPGAILVRAPRPGAMGHIVIVADDGRTVEAYNTAEGVVSKSALGRRWDVGCLVPGLEYVRGRMISSVRPTILRFGSRGVEVGELQKRLGVPVDCIFGSVTEAAVVAFQKAHGLVVDGEVGPKTREAMGWG